MFRIAQPILPAYRVASQFQAQLRLAATVELLIFAFST